MYYTKLPLTSSHLGPNISVHTSPSHTRNLHPSRKQTMFHTHTKHMMNSDINSIPAAQSDFRYSGVRTVGSNPSCDIHVYMYPRPITLYSLLTNGYRQLFPQG